jgi:hypothetical protein
MRAAVVAVVSSCLRVPSSHSLPSFHSLTHSLTTPSLTTHSLTHSLTTPSLTTP